MLGGVDVAVVGGGLIGMATARELARRGLGVTVFERATKLGAGQSGHSSNVIHSGAFYAPGSLKARLAVRGREALESFIGSNGLPFRRVGKLVVRQRGEGDLFDGLALRASANGVHAEILDAGALAEFEPAVRGERALWLPTVAVTDFVAVLGALTEEVALAGGDVMMGAHAVIESGRLIANDRAVEARHIVVAAGIGFNALCPDREWRIVGFRGAYRGLVAPCVERLVYAVPDPRYPFLGVHVTPSVDGSTTVGPTATVYPPVSPGRTLALAVRNWRAGFEEIGVRVSSSLMERRVRCYLPDAVVGREIVKSGVRAQAVDRRGRYADDFVIVREPGITFVANAPSPAATACLAIGEHIVDEVVKER